AEGSAAFSFSAGFSGAAVGSDDSSSADFFLEQPAATRAARVTQKGTRQRRPRIESLLNRDLTSSEWWRGFRKWSGPRQGLNRPENCQFPGSAGCGCSGLLSARVASGIGSFGCEFAISTA